MDPLTPNDPLWKLLGEARRVEVRGNFTANVLREARNTAQDKGLLAKLAAALRGESLPWLRPVLATALILAAGLAFWPKQEQQSGTTVATTNVTQTAVTTAEVAPLEDADMALIANDVDQALEGLDHMNALLAMEDTSSLTDTEIAFLLY